MSEVSSNYDDAARLSFGDYAIHLSASASRVEYLLRRLSQTLTVDNPDAQPMIAAARRLVEQLEVGEQRGGVPERDIPITRLLPTQMYRVVVERDSRLKGLAGRLRTSLMSENASETTTSQFSELADLVDALHDGLRRQADQAIVGD